VCLFIGTCPASAALYQDNFTATVTGIQQTTPAGPYNPYGFTIGQQFSWHILYDTATIMGSTLTFDPSHPTNQIYIPIPRSGLSPLIFTQVNDDNYLGGFCQGIYQFGALQELQHSIGFNFIIYASPYDGAISYDWNQGKVYFDGPDGEGSLIYLNTGIFAFNPDTDRQVVPIPGALVLLGSGVAALTILKRRKG
jgi:hypothetical protein